MTIKELINKYRFKDMTKIEIRHDDYFVMICKNHTTPPYFENEEVGDFFCNNENNLVINIIEKEQKQDE